MLVSFTEPPRLSAALNFKSQEPKEPSFPALVSKRIGAPSLGGD
jgi:hypothetical protein